MSTALLEGRVALVTGGGRGVGAAIAEALVRHGAGVMIADSGVEVDGTDPDAAVAGSAARALGARAATFAGDIAAPEGAAAAVQATTERFGGLDIVVNCAAVLRDALIFKARPDDWDCVIRNNLSAAFYVLSAATPVLREQAKAGRTGGRVINIVSSAGFYGNFGQVAYASTKAGLCGLTRVVALDMARSGVTCNAIAPFAATRVTERIRPANDEQAQYKERALRVGAHHVGTFAAWLCTDAARDVTGQFFGVRGRELFLWSQPRPAERITHSSDWDLPALDEAVSSGLAPKFADLTTDLEAFNTEPAV